MRTLHTVVLPLLLTACLVQPPSDSAEDSTAKGSTTEETPAVPRDAPDGQAPTVVVEDPEAKAPDPIVPPPPAGGLQGVDLVGHGLRVTLYPPFQVALTDDFVPGYVEKDAEDGLILSWWNTSDRNVGGGMGMGGLHNAGVAVHPVPEGAATVQQTTLPWPDGTPGTAYRLGETGSYVLLPKELSAAGGMLTVTAGPSDASWAMEVDGARTPLESGKIVHSADPAKGAPFSIDGKPHKPWGPWPESAP